MNRTINAIVFPSAGEVEMRSFELPAPGPHDVVVRTLYTMVSSGTELRVLGGHYGATFPLIPGYCVAGEIVEAGPEVIGYQAGDLVSARDPAKIPGIRSQWGAQASFHSYDTRSASRPILLPEGADPKQYVISEIAAIALRGADAVRPQAGETAIVVGQGLIGALSAGWLAAFGCRVVAVDMSPSRLERSRAWGTAARINASEVDASGRLAALCPDGAPIVVEASGSTPGLRLALGCMRKIETEAAPWPRLLLQANYIEEVPLNPHSFFPGEGMTLITPMDRRVADRQKAVKHIRAGRLQPAAFMDAVVPVREAPEAYLRLRDTPDECFSLVFDWTAGGGGGEQSRPGPR